MMLDPFIINPENVPLTTKLFRYLYKSEIRQGAGIVPSCIDDATKKILYLLINARNEWQFPKGMLEDNDSSLEQRAVQEAKEEAHIDVKIVSKIDSTSYFYYYDPKRVKVFKTTTYFLGKVENVPRILDGRVEDSGDRGIFWDFKWVDFDGALKLLTFDEDKRILNLARTIRL